MLLLNCKDVSVSFGARNVLDIASLSVHDGDMIGLVGINGAGKSTLLSVIYGQTQPDTGQIFKFCDIAYIKQLEMVDAPEDTEHSQHMVSMFSAQQQHEFISGGERTRLKLARALSQPARLLLADEPTSDLDIGGISALEQQLAARTGAVILVSHDRQLLDSICNIIWELDNGRIKEYKGNFSNYYKKSSEEKEQALEEYRDYIAEAQRLQQAISGVKRQSAKMHKTPKRMGNSEARLHKRRSTETQEKLMSTANALISRLRQLEPKEKPAGELQVKMLLGAASPISSKTALAIKHLDVSAGGRLLISNINATVPSNKKCALIGPNGSGKTTLVRYIKNRANGITISPGVDIGWFGQDFDTQLNMDKNVLENAMYSSSQQQSVARTVLARLNFRGDDVFKSVSVLSGGERAKVALSKLLLSDNNMLVLDEPTNHLDLYAMEALQEVLQDYAGTLLLISHDRAIISAVADRIWEIKDGRLLEFDGSLQRRQTEKSEGDLKQRDSATRMQMLRMRMAELNGRLHQKRPEDDAAALEEEYFSLARELRELESSETQRPRKQRKK